MFDLNANSSTIQQFFASFAWIDFIFNINIEVCSGEHVTNLLIARILNTIILWNLSSVLNRFLDIDVSWINADESKIGESERF